MTTRETLKAIHDRGDLLPWLNGETELHFGGNANAEFAVTCFDHPPEMFDFRPVPKPPEKKMRPWTADELWEHRDCWFMRKDGKYAYRADVVSGATISLDGVWYPCSQLFSDYQWTRDGKTWHPCGVEEQP